MNLTEPQLRVLRLILDGKSMHDVPWARLCDLHMKGFIQYDGEKWKLTKAGRAAAKEGT